MINFLKKFYSKFISIIYLSLSSFNIKFKNKENIQKIIKEDEKVKDMISSSIIYVYKIKEECGEYEENVIIKEKKEG